MKRIGRPLVTVLAGATLAALGAGDAAAHHSFAMYESDKVVAVDGVVKEYKWANPHVLLLISGIEAGGTAEKIYTMEFPAPAQVSRNGWTHDTLKAGDKVKAEMHPFKDGKPGGSFLNVTLPDGKVMGR